MKLTLYILAIFLCLSFIPKHSSNYSNIIYRACVNGWYNSIFINNFDKFRKGVNRVNPVGSYESFTNINGTYRMMVWYPDDYFTNPTKKYPVIIMGPGSGETGTNPANTYKYGPGYFIQNGIWDGKVTVGSVTYDPIYISIQTPTTNTSARTCLQYKDTITSRYRVDTMQMYFTGLSMGGQMIDHLLTYYGSASGMTNHARNRGWTAVYVMSTPFPNSSDTDLDSLSKYLALGEYSEQYTNIIGVGDNTSYIEPQDVLPFNNIYPGTVRAFKYNVTGKPYAGTCPTSAHCGWNAIYNPAWADTISGRNLYQTLLSQNRYPSASISDTIYTNNSFTNLQALTNGWGKVITWTQIAGVSTTITSPNNDTTSVTGLLPNNIYRYRIRVQNGTGPTLIYDTVTINTVVVGPSVPPAGKFKKASYQTFKFVKKNA